MTILNVRHISVLCLGLFWGTNAYGAWWNTPAASTTQPAPAPAAAPAEAPKPPANAGKKPFVGVEVIDFKSDFNPKVGAKVTVIYQDSPAARINMKVGDVIARWGDKTITSQQDFEDLVSHAVIGTHCPIGVVRKTGKDLKYDDYTLTIMEDIAHHYPILNTAQVLAGLPDFKKKVIGMTIDEAKECMKEHGLVGADQSFAVSTAAAASTPVKKPGATAAAKGGDKQTVRIPAIIPGAGTPKIVEKKTVPTDLPVSFAFTVVAEKITAVNQETLTPPTVPTPPPTYTAARSSTTPRATPTNPDDFPSTFTPTQQNSSRRRAY